jgi:hypothetical protein
MNKTNKTKKQPGYSRISLFGSSSSSSSFAASILVLQPFEFKQPKF